MDTYYYAIDTGDGDQLTTGLQDYDYARRVARRIATERGESVYLYEIPSEEGAESEEIEPEAD